MTPPMHLERRRTIDPGCLERVNQRRRSRLYELALLSQRLVTTNGERLAAGTVPEILLARPTGGDPAREILLAHWSGSSAALVSCSHTFKCNQFVTSKKVCCHAATAVHEQV